jgi:hypothetical protein
MPVFCWTALCANLLIVAAFPILTATFVMLLLDRYLGMHFFTNDAAGNQMMYVNLFWAWGHPEVYILILPAFGIFSEVVATFSGKGLFSYRSMVWATLGICVLSFMVWLHHFFTMGAGADVNAFFGIMSAIIAVPTGVKVFNWLFTMFRGRIVFRTPMLFAVGFIITFVIGGARRNGIEELLRAAADPSDNRVPAVARACLAALGAQLRMLKAQEFAHLINAWHRSNQTSKRLDEIPGVGPALATALVASVADPKAFRSGPDLGSDRAGAEATL